jgi:hypothetical protein
MFICRTYFEKVILGEECANPKPHPDPYLEGLKALGVRAEETIICEDSPAGTAAYPPLLPPTFVSAHVTLLKLVNCVNMPPEHVFVRWGT